jgi:hypothetical protein
MRIAKLFTLIFALAITTSISAQRYLSPVFSQATRTTAIYGFNYTVLPLAVPGGHTLKQPLVMQVYQPVGDTETARPLIIYLHTGNFFPYPQNGSCGGTLTDSSNVEFANRLAKMGYVVAVADYRLGWNPFSTVELVRRFTLINAAYRGVQDVRSCIRFFRKSADPLNGGTNPFKIDPSKIVVWGQGTGGYLSLATAYLNQFNDIYTTSDPNKFKLPNPAGGFIPMVIEAYNGDLNGELLGPTIVDANYNAISGGAFPIGDTLAIPNTPGYSSAFNLSVNMGGALGDSTWLDPGEIPLISYHVPSDFFAPCGTNILNVPTLNGPQPVVEVSGSCAMQGYAEAYGNNAAFNTIPAGNDPYGDIAKTFNGGLSGFYPFYGTPANSSSPWEWSATTPSPGGAVCNVDAASARSYIDTIIGYYAPRACVVLGLNCQFTISTDELSPFDVGMNVAPIPASSEVTFSAKELIRQINVYDLNGRVVRAISSIDDYTFNLQRQNMPNGLYVAEVRFDQGFVKRKIIFSNN